MEGAKDRNEERDGGRVTRRNKEQTNQDHNEPKKNERNRKELIFKKTNEWGNLGYKKFKKSRNNK